MDAKQVKSMGTRLKQFLTAFDDCFARSESREKLRTYIAGQISDLPRKSIEPIATVASYAPAGKTAPDFGGAVGVTHDSVEGVDITIPVYSFSETHYLADSAVTPAYKGTLFALTGKVNSAAWKGFAAGECLFLGASGSKRGADDWEITYRFAASPNRTGITVGTITGIDKKGWEYMWVRYADAEDAAAKAIVKKPVAVYVEKVYEQGDFSLLGIGT